MPRIVSFIVLVAIVLLISGLFFHVIAGFLLPIFLALILVVIFRPLYLWFVERLKGRSRIAAVITTVSILLSVLLPLSLIVTFAVFEAGAAISIVGRENFGKRFAELRQAFGLSLPERIQSIDDQAAALNPNMLRGEPNNGPQAAAEALQRDLHALHEELTSPADEAPAADESYDWLLESAMAEFDAKAAELARLAPGDETQGAVLLELQEIYYTGVRPRLVRALAPSRIRAWFIVQANPSRQRLEDLRRQIVGSFGGDLGPLALSTGQSLGKFVFSFVIGLIVMTVSIYYFLADGQEMVGSLIYFSPLDHRHVAQLLAQFDRVSRAVVLATLLSALAQGVLAGIGYYLADLGSIFLLMVLTMFLALIPFVGAISVWLPCCLWLLFYEQRTVAAAVLALYCLCVVSTIDNFIKPLILHGQSNLHPLLALLSVLGGVRALGPIGVFVGPMAAAFLQTLLQMLKAEITAMGETPGQEAKGSIPL